MNTLQVLLPFRAPRHLRGLEMQVYCTDTWMGTASLRRVRVAAALNPKPPGPGCAGWARGVQVGACQH